jgi:hypothetical protein
MSTGVSAVLMHQRERMTRGRRSRVAFLPVAAFGAVLLAWVLFAPIGLPAAWSPSGRAIAESGYIALFLGSTEMTLWGSNWRWLTRALVLCLLGLFLYSISHHPGGY